MLVGSPPVVYAGHEANQAVGHYLADLTPWMLYLSSCFHGTGYPVPPAFEAPATTRAADYARDYAESVRDPEAFFVRLGLRLDWSRR